MKIELNKKDWALIIIIISVSFVSFISHYLLYGTGSDNVIVKVNGEITGVYDLENDDTININEGSNILKIKNRKVNMIQADCPDQLCVHQKPISSDHMSIICLPNKVFVEIQSKESSAVDAVTN